MSVVAKEGGKQVIVSLQVRLIEGAWLSEQETNSAIVTDPPTETKLWVQH